jgi:shikimate kinase
MTDASACRVVLMGMMGSGKTTLGTLLSRRTGWPYHDNDALLLAATGQTARQLADRGEGALRDAEAAALRYGLRAPPPSIVAAAGGVVADAELRDLLRREAIVVWLDAPAAVLARRAAVGAHRPWLQSDAAAWLASAAAEREPLYRSVADLVLDTEAGTPAEGVATILEVLARTQCAAFLGTPLATRAAHERRGTRFADTMSGGDR